MKEYLIIFGQIGSCLALFSAFIFGLAIAMSAVFGPDACETNWANYQTKHDVWHGCFVEVEKDNWIRSRYIKYDLNSAQFKED